MSIAELIETIRVAEELNEVEVRRVSFGRWCRHLKRLIVLQDKESQPRHWRFFFFRATTLPASE